MTRNYKFIQDGLFNVPIKPKVQPTVSFEYPADLFYFYVEFEDGTIVEVSYIDSFDGSNGNVFSSAGKLKEYYGWSLLDEGDEDRYKLSKINPAIFKNICDWIYKEGSNPMPVEIYVFEA